MKESDIITGHVNLYQVQDKKKISSNLLSKNNGKYRYFINKKCTCARYVSGVTFTRYPDRQNIR